MYLLFKKNSSLCLLAMGNFCASMAHLRRQMAEPLRVGQGDQEPFDGSAQTHLPSHE